MRISPKGTTRPCGVSTTGASSALGESGFEGVFALFPVGHDGVHELVERAGVVEVLEVAELVGDDVFDARPGGADEVGVEGETARAGEAAPAAFHCPDGEGWFWGIGVEIRPGAFE